jgi:hypothetical protein
MILGRSEAQANGDTELTPKEVAAYLDTLPTDLKQGDKEWRGPCPIHHGTDDNFSVDPETGLWYCHSTCGRGGDIYALHRELHGVDDDFPIIKAGVFGIVGRNGASHQHKSPDVAAGQAAGDGAQAEEPNQALPADAVRQKPARQGFRVTAEYPYGTQLRKVRFEHTSRQQEDKGRPEKQFRWEYLTAETWYSGAGYVPRPLYVNSVFRDRGQAGLALGFEGEGKADVAGELGFAAFSYKGITQEEAKALAGCDVVLWPDNDASAEKQVKAAAQVIACAGQVHSLKLLVPPPAFPPSADIIDAVRGMGWDSPRIEQFLKTAGPYTSNGNAADKKPRQKQDEPEAGACPDDLPQMIVGVEQFVRKFVVLPEPAYLPVALWAIGTHLVEYFDCYPYLLLLSPTKQCGKTRLLEVLETLVARPRHATALTPAVLFRMMEDVPTLLLDEVESFNSKNKSESTQAILSILNAGHRKGANVPRCEPQKQGYEIVDFPVYGAKAFAAIGRLPDTLTDRSIVVTLQRRAKAQKIERFLPRRATAEAKPIHAGLVGFAGACGDTTEQAYEELLSQDLEFLSDRDTDLWMPLFATCSTTSPGRLVELKECAVALSNRKAADDADDSLSLKLLADIREVWPEGEAHLATAALLEKLKALEESPWGGFDLHSRRVAQMLRPFGVEPRCIRTGSRTPRGYVYDDLNSAFERYLGGLLHCCG